MNTLANIFRSTFCLLLFFNCFSVSNGTEIVGKIPENNESNPRHTDLVSKSEKMVTNDKDIQPENKIDKPTSVLAKFWETLMSPLSRKVRGLKKDIKDKDILIEELNATVINLTKSADNQLKKMESWATERTDFRKIKKALEENIKLLVTEKNISKKQINELKENIAEIQSITQSNQEFLESLDLSDEKLSKRLNEFLRAVNTMQNSLDNNLKQTIRELTARSESTDQNITKILAKYDLESQKNDQDLIVKTENLAEEITNQNYWLPAVLIVFAIIFVLRFLQSHSEVKKNRDGLNQITEEMESNNQRFNQNLMKQVKSAEELINLLKTLKDKIAITPTDNKGDSSSLVQDLKRQIAVLEERLRLTTDVSPPGED